MFEELRRLLTSCTPGLGNAADYQRAAVLVPLLAAPAGPEILFEVRARHLEWQPGEICFPGGRIEEEDASPAQAAVRETCEELGIEPVSIRLLGPLDYTVNPIGVIIYPYVGCLDAAAPLAPNSEEVAEIFTVPLAWFLTQAPRQARMEVATRPVSGFPFQLVGPAYPKEWRRRTSYPVLFYEYNGYVIWGLTARVVDGFVNLCRRLGYTGENPPR